MTVQSVNLYKINLAIAKALASKVVATIETSEVQKYSLENFGGPVKVYNNIAIDKKKYKHPYIAVGELGQKSTKTESIDGINIDFSFKQDPIREVEIDGVIEYEGYSKLSEFAEIIIQEIVKKTRSTICETMMKWHYSPKEIKINTQEFTGTIEITYEGVNQF